MSLIARLIGNATPQISGHAWPKAFDLWKRDRITLDALVVGPALITQQDAIAGIYPAQNKIGIEAFHPYENGMPVYLSSTVRVPGGLEYQSQAGVDDPLLSASYFVLDSNPDVGTIKLSDGDGTEIDLTDEGEGEQRIQSFDDQVVLWDEIRKSVVSDLGPEDTKLRRMMWDEKAEGLICVAQARLEFTTEEEIIAELWDVADWLSRNPETRLTRHG